MNFWKLLPVPFLVLAPLDDVTDVVFRELIAVNLPNPDVFFTEFTSADGLNSLGRERVLRKLKYTENQRPVVAQIWGTEPANMEKAARLVQELGFDGVDINMGCPDNAVVKKGAGAALCQTPELAKKLIDAVRSGAPDIPVSVKTRIGFNEINTQEWIGFLLSQKLDVLTIHGRTAEELSKVPAHWDEIGKAVKLRNNISPQTLIIGNGDITSVNAARQMHTSYEVDGVMIGRGIFSNPWVFEKEEKCHSKEEYIELLLKHMHLFEDTWGKTKKFDILKKFFKMYVNNFSNASDLRVKLMACKTSEDVEKVLSF